MENFHQCMICGNSQLILSAPRSDNKFVYVINQLVVRAVN